MVEKLVRQYFSCLFEAYEFSVATLVHFPDFGNWAMVLLSEHCRILFHKDRGELAMAFGPLGSHRTWNRKPRTTWDSGPWYDVGFVLAYLELDQSLLTKHYPPERLDKQMRNIAEKVLPYIREVCELFQEDRFWLEKDRLDGFCHKEIEGQLDSLLGGDGHRSPEKNF